MREIVQVHCGQCGINIGSQFWNLISAEHGISPEGKRSDNDNLQPSHYQPTDINFSETESGSYTPRAVFVDMKAGAINSVKSGQCGPLFCPDNFIHGNSGCGGNWGKGYYTEGAEICDVVMDAVRKEAESCDAMQCFQLVHDLGGGTGSGLGSLLLDKSEEEFPDVLRTSYSVVPSPQVTDVVVGPYNAVLAMHHLVETCHMSFLMDNKALLDICSLRLNLSQPLFSDLNSLVAMAMSGVTSSMRFNGQLNTDMRKLAVNMVSFPRVHFLMTSLAPLIPQFSTSTLSKNSSGKSNCSRDNKSNVVDSGNHVSNNQILMGTKESIMNNTQSTPTSTADNKPTFEELVQEMFDVKNTLLACNPQQGRYLTMAAMFRGSHISMSEIDRQLWKMKDRNSSLFAEWIPDSFKSSLCEVAPPGFDMAGTCVLSNTAVVNVFRRLGETFTTLFRRKAFVHAYMSEGMDEMELTEAESNLNDLVCEYEGAATGGCMGCC